MKKNLVTGVAFLTIALLFLACGGSSSSEPSGFDQFLAQLNKSTPSVTQFQNYGYKGSSISLPSGNGDYVGHYDEDDELHLFWLNGNDTLYNDLKTLVDDADFTTHSSYAAYNTISESTNSSGKFYSGKFGTSSTSYYQLQVSITTTSGTEGGMTIPANFVTLAIEKHL
jgi:hypothetical protein